MAAPVQRTICYGSNTQKGRAATKNTLQVRGGFSELDLVGSQRFEDLFEQLDGLAGKGADCDNVADRFGPGRFVPVCLDACFKAVFVRRDTQILNRLTGPLSALNDP